MRKQILALMLFACAPISAFSGALFTWRLVGQEPVLSVPLSTKEQVFENSPLICTKNGTCDLKRVFLRTEDYDIPKNPAIPNEITIQSTNMLAGFVTDDIDSLTHYSFVQFARGCMWQSYANENGGVETEFAVVRDFQGISRIQHILPNWMVDTNDTDPVYSSDGEPNGRHYFLQLADPIPKWIPDRQGKLFGEERPTIPFAYVTDAPGPATYSPSLLNAVNMSLEFRMCLFKTTDVPLNVSGVDVGAAKAVVCFNWESKFVFDHKELVFKSPKGIHEECKRKFIERERQFHLEQLKKMQSAPAK